MSFNEEKLEDTFCYLFEENGFNHFKGEEIPREKGNVLIENDLISFLKKQYLMFKITDNEISTIVQYLKNISTSSVYDANKLFYKLLSNGFSFKRENNQDKDLFINLIDFNNKDNNIFKFVNQVEIEEYDFRIPDGIVYINGLPLVVLEFKSAIREDATIYDAYIQLTQRYQRDIPELFKYNAFVVISDGVNNKYGTLFTDYEYFYAWKKLAEEDKESEGINSLDTMMKGLFNKNILLEILNDFIYFPDTSKKESKIICRYPQYFSATKVHENILKHLKPEGDGKGGTVFGATGSGKSYAMLYLTRLLMKDKKLKNPTIILITDRSELDKQLSEKFTNAKNFIKDDTVMQIESRDDLKEQLKNKKSGGVYLTTIQKFSEDIQLLTNRPNVICISDEAHRSQLNLEEKQVISEENGVYLTHGFAKCLHESLPNATYVGFTGTPIDATLNVFGHIVSQYTMFEAVNDGIIVNLVYDGRAAKVTLDPQEIDLIEKYYKYCEDHGTNEYQIEQSIHDTARMNSILGNHNRLEKIADDFINDYETRVTENATVKGKVLFVCSTRQIGYEFYKIVLDKRPEWGLAKYSDNIDFSNTRRDEIKKMPKIKMIMTNNKDDNSEFYNLLGNKKDRENAAIEFKNENSNFKIAIVRDMWLTGFDVPCLDVIYLDKPIQQHTLIQAVSRVNRAYEGKDYGVIVDYIGIKQELDFALKKYNNDPEEKFEGVGKAIEIVKDKLSILNDMFYDFDNNKYFNGNSLEQLTCLKNAAEYAQSTEDFEKRFMRHVRDLNRAYKLCVNNEKISKLEKDYIYFYQGVRSIIFKLNKGDAPDVSQMNKMVSQMLENAIQSYGVEELFKVDNNPVNIDLFSDKYIDLINKIQLPNTKIKLLERLLRGVLNDYSKVNKVQADNFTKRLNKLIDDYNEARRDNPLATDVLEEIGDKIVDLCEQVRQDKESHNKYDISIEQKAFYDILKSCAEKYNFEYPHEKLLILSEEVKKLVENKTNYTDWQNREDIKAGLEADLTVLLDENGYPPVPKSAVFGDVFKQAENFKKYNDIKIIS